MADTLLLPHAKLNYLATKRLGDTQMTLLEFLRKNNTYTATTGKPLTIRAVRGLETAGAGSTNRIIAYRRDPQVLKLHIPMPHRFLPVFQDSPLSWVVPGVFRLGGLDIRTAFPLTNFFWDELVTGWNALSGKVSQLAADFGNWFENASWTEVFIRVASPLTNFFWDELVTGWNGLSSKVSQLAGDLTSWVSGVDWSQVFGPAGINAVNGFWLDFKDAFGTLKDQVTGLFNQISDWILNIDWAGVGQSMMQSMWTGMNAIGEQIKAWFLSLIPDWAVQFFGSGTAGESKQAEAGTPANGEQLKAQPSRDVRSSKSPFPEAANGNDSSKSIELLRNFQANLAKTGSSEAAQAIANDNRQDNRDQSMTNNVTIHQQVMEVAQAPAALARASGKAVSGGVSKQRSQIETDPAF